MYMDGTVLILEFPSIPCTSSYMHAISTGLYRPRIKYKIMCRKFMQHGNHTLA